MKCRRCGERVYHTSNRLCINYHTLLCHDCSNEWYEHAKDDAAERQKLLVRLDTAIRATAGAAETDSLVEAIFAKDKELFYKAKEFVESHEKEQTRSEQ